MPKINMNHAYQKFDAFSTYIVNSVKKEKVINPLQFSNELRNIGDIFVSNGQKEIMNKKSKWLAETLVSMKNLKLAGRIYSYLIKLNKGNNKMIEEFAQNGLIIAKRLSDPVHIMARANDLKEIYKYTKPGSEAHLKVLFDEKRALTDIVRNYDNAKKRNVAIVRDLKPIEDYEEKLAAIKIEIAEAFLNSGKNIFDAKNELKEALKIYEKIGEGPNCDKIRNLLKKLS